MRKVPTVCPAVQAHSSYFTLSMTKKSIRSTGVKLARPHLVFATLAFGSGSNLHEVWIEFANSLYLINLIMQSRTNTRKYNMSLCIKKQ